jgi:uncharacterized protein YjbJ (UPF0337 family)
MKGKWNQLKGEIRRKWGKVTDDDLLETEGNMDKLIGKIQERSGEQRDAIVTGSTSTTAKIPRMIRVSLCALSMRAVPAPGSFDIADDSTSRSNRCVTFLHG